MTCQDEDLLRDIAVGKISVHIIDNLQPRFVNDLYTHKLGDTSFSQIKKVVKFIENVMIKQSIYQGNRAIVCYVIYA